MNNQIEEPMKTDYHIIEKVQTRIEQEYHKINPDNDLITLLNLVIVELERLDDKI